MENPLDTTANAQEASASAMARLTERVAQLERTRVIPGSISGASLAAIKAQLPASAPNGTLIIGRIPSGSERAYIYIYESAASKWFRSGAFVEA